MMSFAQFRPEKDHPLQLRVWKKVVPYLPRDAKFVLVGSVRDADDKRIVDSLRKIVIELDIEDSVDFQINLSRADLHSMFKESKVGIHTMRNEHFGIAVCELMAAGMITIAHNSAGPKEDIIGGCKDPIGYLANNEEDYAIFVKEALLNFDRKTEMRKKAREWVSKEFSKEKFN